MNNTEKFLIAILGIARAQDEARARGLIDNGLVSEEMCERAKTLAGLYDNLEDFERDHAEAEARYKEATLTVSAFRLVKDYLNREETR